MEWVERGHRGCGTRTRVVQKLLAKIFDELSNLYTEYLMKSVGDIYIALIEM